MSPPADIDATERTFAGLTVGGWIVLAAVVFGLWHLIGG